MTHNPFSASRISAGQLAFRYPPALAPDQLLKKFSDQGNWGTLIGPHGVGKTTLALDLARRVSFYRLQIYLVTIRQRSIKRWADRFFNRVEVNLEHCSARSNRSLRFYMFGEHLSWNAWQEFLQSSNQEGQELWIVDGIERLSFCRRNRLVTLLKNRGAWGIVTLHSPLWLRVPKLCELQPNPENILDLVDEILKDHPVSFSRNEIAEVLREASGNPRDMFDRLYDLYESRQRRGQKGSFVTDHQE